MTPAAGYRSERVDNDGSRVRVELYWPDPEKGPYLVGVTLEAINERLEIVGVEFWGREPDETVWSNEPPDGEAHPITSTAIRLPLERIATEALKRLRQDVEVEWNYAGLGEQPDAMNEWRQRVNTNLGKLKGTKPTGRPPEYGEEHFAAVAAEYNAAFAAHLNPTGAVAEKFNVSKSAAAKWVHRCRVMGLLPPTSRGRSAATRTTPKQD